MKLIFDFDYTLFQTSKFLEAVGDAYKKHGVTQELFLKTYQESRMGWRDWKPDIQFALLAEEGNIDIAACKSGLSEIVSACGRFLYEDSTFVLETLHKSHELFLVSHGEDSFQHTKVKGSGIGHLFKQVIVTGDITKVTPLSNIVNEEGKNSVFIEDNPLALVESKKAFPWLTTIRINRREGRYADFPDDSSFNFTIRNLFELQKIVA